jgi:hypothetical protein
VSLQFKEGTDCAFMTLYLPLDAARGTLDAARRLLAPIVRRMKTLLAIAAIAALAGCGVETATTAATAGSIKKQELQQGQKTMQHAQQKIDAAAQQMQQRPRSLEQQ